MEQLTKFVNKSFENCENLDLAVRLSEAGGKDPLSGHDVRTGLSEVRTGLNIDASRYSRDDDRGLESSVLSRRHFTVSSHVSSHYLSDREDTEEDPDDCDIDIDDVPDSGLDNADHNTDHNTGLTRTNSSPVGR